MSPCEIASNFGIFLVLAILVVLGALVALLLRDEKQSQQLSQQLHHVSQQLHAEAEEIKKILAQQGRILAQQGRTARRSVRLSVAALILTAIALVFQVEARWNENGANGTVTPAAPNNGGSNNSGSNGGEPNGGEELAEVLGKIHLTLENIEGTLQGSKDAAEKPAAKAGEKPAAKAAGMQADLSDLLAEMKTLNRCVMRITKDIGGIRKALPTPPAPAKKAPAAGGGAAGKPQGSGSAGGQGAK